MEQHALPPGFEQVILAIPFTVYCKGLASFFADEGFTIHEVKTANELEHKLSIKQACFVIVEQSLIHDISLLPGGRFIVMARIQDEMLFLETVAHKACGYFLYPVSFNLIREAMCASPNHCYLDPALTSWVASLLTEKEQFPYLDVVLTPREREVFALREQHLSIREIAKRLTIGEETVKKHAQNARSKLLAYRKEMEEKGKIER